MFKGTILECKRGQLLFFGDRLELLWNLQRFSILDKANRIRRDYSLVEEFGKVQNMLLHFITKGAPPLEIFIRSLLCVKSQVTLLGPFPQPCNHCNVCGSSVKMLCRQWFKTLAMSLTFGHLCSTHVGRPPTVTRCGVLKQRRWN